MPKLLRPILFVIAILLLTSLACAIPGRGNTPAATASAITAPAATESGNSAPPTSDGAPPTNEPIGGEEPTATPEAGGQDTEFPMPDDAQNQIETAGTLIFQTNLSLEETMEFYRQAFTAKGYTERTLLTVTSDTTFSMVFDGHASGKAIVVQGVDLGTSTNVSIRLEAT